MWRLARDKGLELGKVKIMQDLATVWGELPVIARVNLCRAVGVPGRVGSAPWVEITAKHQAALTPMLVDDTPGAPQPDTNPDDRNVQAGWSDGKPVYRASTAGHCMKELFLWRIGAGSEFPPRDDSYETEDKGMLGAREGSLHEGWIVQSLADQGYELAWTGKEQRELEKRFKRFVVKSHPDGMIRGKELGDTWHVLECKALNEDRFALWKTKGWDGFQNYAHQVSLEMYLSQAPSLFIVKNRNTGEMVKQVYDQPPINPTKILNKFSAIENLVETPMEGQPSCGDDAEWFWCPFFNIGKCDILSGKDAEVLEEVEDPAFEKILTAYRACKVGEKRIKVMMGALRTQIEDRMVQPRLRAGKFFVAWSTKTRKNFNLEGAKEALGDRAAEFEYESQYQELRVTGGPSDEELLGAETDAATS